MLDIFAFVIEKDILSLLKRCKTCLTIKKVL